MSCQSKLSGQFEDGNGKGFTLYESVSVNIFSFVECETTPVNLYKNMRNVYSALRGEVDEKLVLYLKQRISSWICLKINYVYTSFSN